MRITCRHLVIAIAAIAILLATAMGAATGTSQIVDASSAPAMMNESIVMPSAASSGSGQWPVYLAGGVVIGILTVGILFILRERSGK